MKIERLILTLMIAALTACGAAQLAQSGSLTVGYVTAHGTCTSQTLDSFSVAGSYLSANSFFKQDAQTLFAVGEGMATGWTGYTRKTTDGGLTWATVDSVADSQFLKVARSGVTGTLFVVGETTVTIGQLFVRKSTDGGQTWSTVDTWNGAYLGGASAGLGDRVRGVDLKVDADGRIFVVGNSVSTDPNFAYWTVRESSDDGNTWTSVDAQQFQRPFDNVYTYISPNRLAIDANGDLFVSGYSAAEYADNRQYGEVLVRKSTDHGATWTTILDRQFDGKVDSVNDISVRDSEVLVAGFTSPIGNYPPVNWIGFGSQDSGQTWTGPQTTLLNFPSSQLDVGQRFFPSGALYGLLRWNNGRYADASTQVFDALQQIVIKDPAGIVDIFPADTNSFIEAGFYKEAWVIKLATCQGSL